jgi:hypothetical protein
MSRLNKKEKLKMGSWDGTCALTNLPIKAGTEVVLFILEKHSYNEVDEVGGGCVHADALYTPIPFPIIGEYDDYGTLEDIKTDLSLLNAYMETKHKIEHGSDYIRDIERGEHAGLASVMVIKEIYDQMIAHNSTKSDYFAKGQTVKDMFDELIDKHLHNARHDMELFNELHEINPKLALNYRLSCFRFMDYDTLTVGAEQLIINNDGIRFQIIFNNF